MAYWTRTKGAKRESYRKRRTRIENVRVDGTTIIFTLATGVEHYFELTHDRAAWLADVLSEITQPAQT